MSAGALLRSARGGAAALGLGRWDDVEADRAHPSLRGADDPLAALVHGCSAEVLG